MRYVRIALAALLIAGVLLTAGLAVMTAGESGNANYKELLSNGLFPAASADGLGLPPCCSLPPPPPGGDP
jgi:hypothetical protein